MSKGMTNDCSHCAILPLDIITDVLSRLPVKSLCRFKCNSPSWKSLISSPYFAQTHLSRTKTNNPKHLDRNILLISTSHGLYSVNLTADVPVATKLDFPSLPQSENKWVNVSSSCNGLLLVSDISNSNLFLLNPSTREYEKLPTPPFILDPSRGFCKNVFGMGYDSSTDDYKVVTISNFDAQSESECESESHNERTFVAVYSLKTNAWKRIEDTHYSLVGGPTMHAVYCNGCLHLICWRADSYLMVAFDLADEIFREVPSPASLIRDGDYHEVVIVGDCLCLVYELGSDPVEVWMMKEYGVRESWTKIMTDVHDMCPEGRLAEDEFLLVGNMMQTQNQDKLVTYNPKKGTLKDIVVHGIPTQFRFCSWGTYVESHISPNQCNHRRGIGKQG